METIQCQGRAKKPTAEQEEILSSWGVVIPPSRLAAESIIKYLENKRTRRFRTGALRTLQDRYLGRRVAVNRYPSRPTGVVEFITPRNGAVNADSAIVVTRVDRWSRRSVPFDACIRLSDGSTRQVSLDWLEVIEEAEKTG